MGATVFVHLYYSKAREDCQCKTAFFFFFLLESFCFNAPSRETAQRAAPTKAFCAWVFCAVVPCGTIRMLNLEGYPQKTADDQLGGAL